MMIVLAILPVLAFGLLWLVLLSRQTKEEEEGYLWQETLIRTALYWSAFLVLGTEFLSLLKALTTLGVALLWGAGVVALAVVLWRQDGFARGWRRLKAEIRPKKHAFSTISFGVIAIVLLILLITGLMSPPSIHDVMTYHMSRVMQWIQNRSLAFFPTSITWQLWMPPFSEMSQLNWQLLTGSDVLSFFPQWYSLILTMVAVSATAKRFGARRRGQWLAALFVLSSPIVILQTSGAKNDVVLAFFFAALAYYVVKAAFQPLSRKDWAPAGIAVGLGILTKGNFPFFALPLLIWLLVVVLKKTGWKKALLFLLVGVLAVTAMNGGQWVRNTVTFGGPFNTAGANFTLNTRFGGDVVISNLSRNIAVQMMSVGVVNSTIQQALVKIHAWLGIPLFDQTITHGPTEFYDVPTREEVAGNPLQFVITGLVVLVLLIGLLNKKKRPASWPPAILALAAIAGMVIFSGVFRWQVWGSRYFLPYYVMFAPIVGFVAGKRLPRWTSWLLAAALVLVMVNPLMNNYSRSFSWAPENRNSIWTMSRKGLLFANHQTYEGGILELTYLMDVSGCRTYGLVQGSNSPEYLIWATLTPDAGEYYIEHIAVDNATAVHATPGFDPCGVIVFEAGAPALVTGPDFSLAEKWQFTPDGGYPLSLYLKPEFLPEP